MYRNFLPRAVRYCRLLITGKACFRWLFTCCLWLLPLTATAQTDITAQILQNQNVVLTGGAYLIRIPVAGVPGTATVAVANAYAMYSLNDYNSGHFVSSSAPAIVYRGVISGTGSLTVTNASSTVNPSSTPDGVNHPFTGGLLLFTNPQTFSSGVSDPSLIIDGNTTVAFDQGKSPDVGGSFNPDSTHPRNITNNGYLYSWNNNPNGVQNRWGSIVATEAGAGVVTFENGNVLTNGNKYTGLAYVMNGAHVQQQATFPDSATSIVQSNIVTFETQGSNYLVGPAATYKSVFTGNYYSWGADTQITGKGVQVFTGLNLPCRADTKKDHLSAEEARKLDYLTNCAFGAVFYIQASMQMGDGAPVVDNGDGTNNTFLQTNVEVSQLISTGNFESAPHSEADALHNQAIGFDYSGVYSYDAGVNASYGSNGLNANRLTWGNLALLDPDPTLTGKKPNHLILTSPLFMDGITQIEQNAILQLGDGTPGNASHKSIVVNGKTYSGSYSSSYGNGILITRENSTALRQSLAGHVSVADYDEIINNGQLIVDNVPGALDITQADSAVRAIYEANELDTISGSGSLKQEGSLPLTLMENTTYTGVTEIADGTLALAVSPGGVAPSLATSSGINLSGSGGIFDISQAGNQTIQDLTGVSGSTVALGANTLTTDTANTTKFAGGFTGVGGVLKQGNGTLILDGASSATGATVVRAGTLQIGDETSSSVALGGALQIASDGSLTVVGTGSIKGDLVSQGSVTFKNASAVLEVGSVVTSSGPVTMEVNPNSASSLTASGAATVSGPLTVQLDAGNYVGRTYTLLSAASVSGAFSAINIVGANIAPLTPQVSMTPTAVLLTLVAANPAVPTLALTATPATTQQGTPVLLHAVLSNTSSQPTGNLSFLDGSTVLGTAGLDTSASASLSISNFASGQHTVTATYSGDANNTSASGSVVVTIMPVATASTVALIATPSAATVGANITLQATVSSATTGSATGTITFFDGSTALGTATISNNVGSLNTSALAAGTHNITASYSGDTAYLASSSTAVLVTITQSAVSNPSPTPQGDFSLTPSTSTVSLAMGQAGTVNMAVAGVNGFSQTVALSCSIAGNATCNLSQTTIDLANGNTKCVLTITALNSFAMDHMSHSTTIAAGAAFWGVGLLLFGRHRRLGERGRAALICLLCLAGCGVLSALSGCGLTINSTTAKATVTASSGSLTHSTIISINIHQ